MKDLILLTVFTLFPLNLFASDILDEQPLILRGSVDGYETRNFDDRLNFGLVLPTLTKAQVLDFRLSSVLSTELDVIRAAGQRIEVPSNVSLPNQRERYFITIRINKPNFRLPIHDSVLPQKVAVVEGAMPFERTVDALRGGAPLFSVVNSFDFNTFSLAEVSGLESDIEMTARENSIDHGSVVFSLPFEVDQDYVALGLNLEHSLNEDGEKLFFPVSMKTLERSEDLMQSSQDNVPMIVTVPKATFNSELDEITKLPFPFSLVWGESEPEIMLPLAKDFIQYSKDEDQNTLDIDLEKLEDFNIIAFKLTLLDQDGKIVLDDVYNSPSDQIVWSDQEDLNISRVRLDVIAVDPDPVLESINSRYMLSDDVFSQAKYITRYEADLN
jgi:hypothetical protein